MVFAMASATGLRSLAGIGLVDVVPSGTTIAGLWNIDLSVPSGGQCNSSKK